MKKVLLWVFMLAASAMSAQQRTPLLADKKPPIKDPTQLGDFQAPDISCLNGLTINIMPSSFATIFASDLVDMVFDNATPKDKIRLGIRVAGSGTGFPLDAQLQPNTALYFTCSDVGDTINAEVWAMDLAGNTAFCTTQFRVLDNLHNCPQQIKVNVCARTYCGDMALANATILIYGKANFTPPFAFFYFSGNSGCFDGPWGNNPIESTFSVSTELDDDPLDGVDLQDLELLSKHLSGQQPFTENWQWVAADINRDNQITLEDSIELRKVIDHEYLGFPQNTSWRFVVSGYTFPSPDPLSQPVLDTISVGALFSVMDTTFLGIKIGDLDCSADPQFAAAPVSGKVQFSGGIKRTETGVFPNPASGSSMLKLDMPQSGRASVFLTDLQGRRVWETGVFLEKGKHTLDIPSPGPGVYFWNVETENGFSSGKLIFY